jgi:hypothetical protein
MFSHLMATQHCAWSGAATVYFETWYANHFLAAGLIPPLNAKFLERHPAWAWAKAAEAFRERSHTPIYPGSDGIGSDKPRIQLVSVLGPHRSGGSILQIMLNEHLGFQAIQEHHTLYHLVAHAGRDHRARHFGSEVEGWLKEGVPDDLDIKPYERQGYDSKALLKQERGYTILEAYFRVLQSIIPASAMKFAKAYGQITVIDRSCSHALVADVLFQSLPEHRAVLVVRDPMDQITSVLSMQEQHPKEWGGREKENNLENLCRSYLRCLATPLAAAPVGQLKLMLFEELQSSPYTVIEETCRFLGLHPNYLLALETIDCNTHNAVNTVYSEEYSRRIKELREEFLRENEPWKRRCLENGTYEAADSAQRISASDLPAWISTLLQPVQRVIKELSGDEIVGSRVHFMHDLDKSSARYELQVLVETVVTGLKRHFAHHKNPET